jgi:hypothetical protein
LSKVLDMASVSQMLDMPWVSKVFEEKARLREGLSLVGSVVWSTPGRPTDLPDIEGLSLAVEAAEVRRHVHRGRVKELVPVDVQHPLQLVLYSSSSACV